MIRRCIPDPRYSTGYAADAIRFLFVSFYRSITGETPAKHVFSVKIILELQKCGALNPGLRESCNKWVYNCPQKAVSQS